jgi:hypothetical protein
MLLQFSRATKREMALVTLLPSLEPTFFAIVVQKCSLPPQLAYRHRSSDVKGRREPQCPVPGNGAISNPDCQGSST